MKKFAFAVFLGTAVISAFAQTAKTKPASQPKAADPVVISFGTTEVRQSEFESAIRTLPAEYQEMAKGPARRNFAEEYVRMKMLAVEAQKQGLEKDPDVQAQLRLVRDNTLANAALTKLQSSIKVGDAELKKAYDEQKKTFERVKARHILIAPQGSAAAPPGDKQLTDEQARAKADEIRKKLLAGGKFEELAKESHDTASGARGGELGEFGRGDMVPEFEKVAFESEIGKVAPVVKTQFGYHIIRVDERKTTTLAEARPQLEPGIKQRLVQDRLEAMKKSANAKFDETYFPPPPPTAPAPPVVQPPKPN